MPFGAIERSWVRADAVKNFWPKKSKTFGISLSIFLIAFLAVSLHEEPKIRPDNLKKQGGGGVDEEGAMAPALRLFARGL
jgi:hypothetical protein